MKQLFGINQVDDTDTRHDGCSVCNGQSFADTHRERLQAVFFQDGCRISFLAPVEYFAFANQGEGDMRQLHQIAAGTYTAVFGDIWIDIPVDKLGE